MHLVVLITNLKQGFFIFFFYVLRQEKVSHYKHNVAMCLNETWVNNIQYTFVYVCVCVCLGVVLGGI